MLSIGLKPKRFCAQAQRRSTPNAGQGEKLRSLGRTARRSAFRGLRAGLWGFALWALVAVVARADSGFHLEGGQWPAQGLKVVAATAESANQALPTLPFLLWRNDKGEYFLSQGAGIPALSIPDLPQARAWQLMPADGCAGLFPVSLSRLRQQSQPVQARAASLPLDAAAQFTGLWHSHDQRLTVSVSFDGQIRQVKRPAGWAGEEGLQLRPQYSGQRWLTLIHPDGRKARFVEPLHREFGYLNRKIHYLPEPGWVLVLEDGDPQARFYCLAL